MSKNNHRFIATFYFLSYNNVLHFSPIVKTYIQHNSTVRKRKLEKLLIVTDIKLKNCIDVISLKWR